MSDEKILTIKEIAKQLMAEQIELGFWGYTQLDGAAAEILSMHEGYIYLHHLTEISDAAAESLSRGGESLSLDGRCRHSERNGLWRIRQTCWIRQNKSCRT